MNGLSWGSSLGEISGKKYPKLNLLKKDPIASSIASKLVTDQGNGGLSAHRRRDAPPAESVIRRISDDVTQNINDSTNIFQLLPDTELAMQILVSSILSPKDMVNVELGFHVGPNVLESEVAGPMVEVVREYFEDVYKIKTYLPKMLEEILFTKGSYPLMVLPESSLDAIINSDRAVSFESFRGSLGRDGKPIPSIGLLGKRESNQSTFSLEHFTQHNTTVSTEETKVKTIDKFNDLLQVSDNFEALKFPSVVDKMRQQRISDALGYKKASFESRQKKDEMSDEEITRSLYRHRTYQRQPYQHIKTPTEVGRENVGHPLVMKLPPEAVIPVHVPSNPEDHVGYFLLLDQYGNPLNRVREADYYRDISQNLSSNTDVSSQLLAAGQRASGGLDRRDNANLEVAEAVRIYADIVERDLVQRLKNGVYGDGIEISRPLDVYQVMLARSLSNMGTQILYVPAELMTYMAFDFNQFGVGKSLLDDNKILASIRAMLMFSNTMAAIKNSVGRTGLRIQLDPEDPDPASTVEYMVHEYSRNRSAAYPLGASNPTDLIDFLQNAGIDVQVSGNAAYPETTLDVEDKSMNRVQPDSQLEDDIKHKFFMSLGMSPETIDLSSNVEFATSVVTSNLLLAKRVIIYQDKLLALVKDHMDKYIRNSSILLERLHKAIEDNKKGLGSETKKLEPDQLINLFLGGLNVTLPRPDSAKLENQIQAFDLYSDALEKAVDAYFGEDSFMLQEFDDIESDMRGVRAAVIAYFKRQWLRNNNVLPELMDLVALNDDGDPELDLLKIHGSHLENIGKSVADLMEKMRKDREKREKQLEEKEETSTDGGDGDAGGDGGSDPWADDTSDDGGDPWADDDVGGDDTGGGEEPAEPSEEPVDDGDDATDTGDTEEETASEEPEETDTGEPETSEEPSEEPAEPETSDDPETTEVSEEPTEPTEGGEEPEEVEEPEAPEEPEPEEPEESEEPEETPEEEPEAEEPEEEVEVPEEPESSDIDGEEEPEEPDASDGEEEEEAVNEAEDDAEGAEIQEEETPQEPDTSDDEEDGLGETPAEPESSETDEEEEDDENTNQ